VLRGPAFWLLTVAFSLGTLAQVAIGVHLIPYLAEGGYGLGEAATVTGLVGAAQVLGRVVVTFLEGRLPRDWMMAGIFALQAAALVVLIGWQGTSGLVVFVVSFGAASGAMTITRASSVAEFFGSAHYGSIGGMVAMFVIGARTVAPVGAGALYAVTGGYGTVLWAMVSASTLATIAMFLAQRIAPPAGPDMCTESDG
jgi:predicted MFS family arabinose efflux permease